MRYIYTTTPERAAKLHKELLTSFVKLPSGDFTPALNEIEVIFRPRKHVKVEKETRK